MSEQNPDIITLYKEYWQDFAGNAAVKKSRLYVTC